MTSTFEVERSKLLSRALVTSVLNRGLTAITPLLLVPLALGYLGVRDYGAWLAAVSLTSFAAFSDFGIGTGLMTKLGGLDLTHRDDREDGRKYVTSAYIAVGAITAVATVLLAASSAIVSWSSILTGGVDDTRTSLIVVVTFAAVLANVPLSLVVRVQYGVGQQAQANLWLAGGSAASLASAWVAVQLDPGPVWFVALTVIAPVVFSLVNTVVFFTARTAGRTVCPALRYLELDTSRDVLRLGLKFVVVSILVTASVATDPWIVARTSALSEVPNYAVPFRLFGFVGTIGIMLSTPLWPLHARAVRAGDVAWIRRITVRMTVATTLSIVVVSSVLMVTGNAVLAAWLPSGSVVYSLVLWLGLGLWWAVQGATGPMFMVQNGAEVVAPQLVAYLLLLLALPVKWVVAQRYGYQWIPWVGAASYAALIWPACVVGYHRAIRLASHDDASLEV